MSTVLEIEKAIESLAREDLHQLRQWFDEYDATSAASARVFELYDAEEGDLKKALEDSVNGNRSAFVAVEDI